MGLTKEEKQTIFEEIELTIYRKLNDRSLNYGVENGLCTAVYDAQLEINNLPYINTCDLYVNRIFKRIIELILSYKGVYYNPNSLYILPPIKKKLYKKIRKAILKEAIEQVKKLEL